MKEENNNRVKWLHLRLTEAEFTQIQKAFTQTTQRKISDYARRILLGKPMIGSYRNASMDELMMELIRLRKDLNGLANNFNQAVHKLHTLDHLVQFQSWLMRYEQEKNTLFAKMEEVRIHMAKIGEKWLQ